LGLFIGKLGKDKVFFVIPRQAESLHLPTDLLGINPGNYDDKREDDNLLAALGPFCNQVRSRFKTFIYESLHDLIMETKEARELAGNRSGYWEYLLAAELLEPKLNKIAASYDELDKGLIFIKTKRITERQEFSNWFQTALKDVVNLIQIFSITVTKELVKSFGESGVPGNVIEIKTATDRLVSVAKELLAWEHNLISIQFDDGLIPIKDLMRGWTKSIFSELAKIPSELRTFVSHHKEGKAYTMNLTIPGPNNVDEVMQILEDYYSVDNNSLFNYYKL
jgi:hypothetical protein